MNETLTLLMERKSDRSFTDEAVAGADLDAVINAGHQAPTSCNGQHVSVIVVRDAAKRAKIAEYAGNQPWIAKAPVFLAVVYDLYKLGKGVVRSGKTQKVQDYVEGLVMGGLDCGIAAAHMAIAAASLNLGTVTIGGIRNNPAGMIELLGLPELTFVPVGLCVGHVKTPGLKRPRMAVGTFRHEETYSTAGLDEAIAGYDKELLAFWQEHARKDGQSWSDSIGPRFCRNERPDVGPVLAKQGMRFSE